MELCRNIVGYLDAKRILDRERKVNEIETVGRHVGPKICRRSDLFSTPKWWTMIYEAVPQRRSCSDTSLDENRGVINRQSECGAGLFVMRR